MNKTIRILLYSLSMILAFQLGCDNAAETGPTTLAKMCEIHLQSWFSQTRVEVFVDHARLFGDTVSSNPIVGLSKVIPVQIANGPHSLRVVVSDTVSKDSSFTIQDTLFIGVSYDQKESQIYFFYSRDRFWYD